MNFPYQPMYQQNYPNYQPMQQTIQQPTYQPTIQNGGFAVVRSEREARDYLLSPGTFMTFKDENSQYMYEKSRSFSQLEPPTFKKFRLVEEEETQPIEVVDAPQEAYALQTEYKALCDEVEALKGEIDTLREMMNKKPTTKRKEATDE